MTLQTQKGKAFKALTITIRTIHSLTKHNRIINSSSIMHKFSFKYSHSHNEAVEVEGLSVDGPTENSRERRDRLSLAISP